MDYEKKYKEALAKAREIKSKILSSHLSTESCKAVSEYIDEIIPELRESEDERIRKDIIGGLMWQRDNLKSEGPHDNNLILPGFCLNVGKHLTYLEKQKDTNCLACDQHLKGYLAGRKATEEEKQKEQKPVETSDFKTKLAAYLQNNSPKDGQYVISSETILEMAKEELIKRGVVVEREQCCIGIKGDPDPAGVWKPTEEQMKAIDFAMRVLFETYPSLHNGCEPYHILGELYEQLKKL